MTRRRVKLIALAFLLILAALAAYPFLFPDPVSEANFQKIHAGATLADVQALLDRQPDLISRMKGRVDGPGVFAANPNEARDYYLRQWNAHQITIVVVLDEDDQVVCRYRGASVLQPWYQRVLDAVKRSFRL